MDSRSPVLWRHLHKKKRACPHGTGGAPERDTVPIWPILCWWWDVKPYSINQPERDTSWQTRTLMFRLTSQTSYLVVRPCRGRCSVLNFKRVSVCVTRRRGSRRREIAYDVPRSPETYFVLHVRSRRPSFLSRRLFADGGSKVRCQDNWHSDHCWLP